MNNQQLTKIMQSIVAKCPMATVKLREPLTDEQRANLRANLAGFDQFYRLRLEAKDRWHLRQSGATWK